MGEGVHGFESTRHRRRPKSLAGGKGNESLRKSGEYKKDDAVIVPTKHGLQQGTIEEVGAWGTLMVRVAGSRPQPFNPLVVTKVEK